MKICRNTAKAHSGTGRQAGPFTTQLAYAATAVALLVYAVGFLASFWLPEPGERLPE